MAQSQWKWPNIRKKTYKNLKMGQNARSRRILAFLTSAVLVTPQGGGRGGGRGCGVDGGDVGGVQY